MEGIPTTAHLLYEWFRGLICLIYLEECIEVIFNAQSERERIMSTGL